MRTEHKVWILTIFFAGLFALGLYSAFKPESYPLKFIRGEVRPISENVIIGPYPEKKEWRRLGEDIGVDVIVSLMDPASVVEGGFVKTEKAMAHKYGMEFKNFPMDFLHLSDESNKVAAAALARYILKSKGKKLFYVHCYLGRHRVEVFGDAYKALLKETNPAGVQEASTATTTS
ncbi:MAG: hypothetical protein ACE5DW_05025 [Thermodesulfobacteriota bacterium]